MKKLNIRKIIEFAIAAIMVVFLSWIVISYIEVAVNNLTPGYEYSAWNFFVHMVDMANELRG